VKGRLLTLKLKVRAKEAPLETAKFMGHGVCDNHSKSTALAAPTRDPQVIERHVAALLRQLNSKRRERRSLGIFYRRFFGASTGLATSFNRFFLGLTGSPCGFDGSYSAVLDCAGLFYYKDSLGISHGIYEVLLTALLSFTAF